MNFLYQVSPHIYQVKVTLQNIEPPIWRRLLIPADLFLHDFHKVLQTAMGWENQHLHLFLKGKRMYGIADDEWSNDKGFQDYTPVRVNDLLRKPGDEMVYQYDLGDNWRHSIELEEITKPEPLEYYPMCTEGARECPPEDCGGPYGYQDMLAAVNNPSDPQHQFYKEMYPEGLDPEFFDKEEVNDFLLEDDYGCLMPYDEEED